MGVSAVSSVPGVPNAHGLRTQAGQRVSAAADTAPSPPGRTNPAQAEDDRKASPAENAAQTSVTLSKEALDQLARLKARDRKVRQHEAAHMAAAGGLVTSGASYTYQRGPDGARYAIGGEVGIDTSPGRTPQETLDRATQIQAAALAPAEPSGQDLAVAAKAQQMALQARIEMAHQSRADTSGAQDPDSTLRRTYGSGESDRRSPLSVFA